MIDSGAGSRQPRPPAVVPVAAGFAGAGFAGWDLLELVDARRLASILFMA